MLTLEKNRFRPHLEQLECRLVPAVRAEFDSALSQLTVWGTTDPDRIDVRQQEGRISVVGATINEAGVQKNSLNALRVNVIRVYGGRGDDVIRFQTVWVGDVARDALNRNFHSRLYGGPGSDTLKGGTGTDLLVGGMGTDFLWGRGGFDTLFGDSEYTGVQTGTLMPGPRPTSYNFEAYVYYGSGVVSTNADSAEFALQEANPLACGNDQLHGGGGNDLLFGGFSDDTIWGDAGNDDLYGMDGNDLVIGDTGQLVTTGGNDRLFGGAGTDFLFGEWGHDYLGGGVGDDWLYGGEGDDIVCGQDGFDRLWGENGQDVLWGGNHDDQLYGGVGVDLLYGEDGNDQLNGGGRNDANRNQLMGGLGNDTLVNYVWKDDDDPDILPSKLGA